MLNNPLDFTAQAQSVLDRVAGDAHFWESEDANLIYKQLEKNLHTVSFGDYLKRYIYQKAGLTGNFQEVPLDEYRDMIRNTFQEHDTPASFQPTTAKISALSRNWLTQQSVKRNVVFLLGFGLGMDVDEVNSFLVKALREPEINFKDPFEIICWYCYRNKYRYPRFSRLWTKYQETPAITAANGSIMTEQTENVRRSVYTIRDDDALVSYLLHMKTEYSRTGGRVTVKKWYDKLYAETRQLIAELYNKSEEELWERELQQYKDTLAQNQKLYNYEKLRLIAQRKNTRKVYRKEDITESDIEHVLYAAIPKDQYGNLTSSREAHLNAQFEGKRLNRQRMNEIAAGRTEIDRFDILTLHFFVFAQRAENFPVSRMRLDKFVELANEILRQCSMGEMYIANPYECFLMMCILSDTPLGTFADVWELAYQEGQSATEPEY